MAHHGLAFDANRPAPAPVSGVSTPSNAAVVMSPERRTPKEMQLGLP